MDAPAGIRGLELGGVDEVLTKEEFLKRLNYGMDPAEVEAMTKAAEAKKQAATDKVELGTKAATSPIYKPAKIAIKVAK